ncbi:unnamed protein product [Enterobius vermicularis]|uniref:Programmed cell death protein n=1 Tax=Enterobius vermicularis TaxID=51028 RepID=A0A0N4V4R7_ENTVE|nr:unnamed protein product [Enterobius vermicularis]
MSSMDSLRAQRMQQFQQEGGRPGDDKAEQARQAAEQQEMAKNSILSQVLDQSAMARLSNLAAAKPEKAKMVENTIIQMARLGQIAGKLTDEGLKQILDRMAGQTQRTTTVKVAFCTDAFKIVNFMKPCVFMQL